MWNPSIDDLPVILTRKITAPSVPSDFLLRKRLATLLDTYSKLPATLIQAPAGYGKSCLMSSWAEKSGRTCVWVSLDKEDGALDRFWAYVLAALANEGVVSEGMISEAKNLEDPEKALRLADRLLARVEEYTEEVVLLLDDCHTIDTGSAVPGSLTYFIMHAPSNMHVIMSTRSPLDIKLSKLAVQDQLGKISEDDLTFTEGEIEDYYSKKHMPISKEDVQAVSQQTQGWAVAMKLFSMSGDDPKAIMDLHSPSQTKEAVGAYLFEEVLSHLAAREYDFLEATCCLDSFSAPLAVHVLNADDEAVASSISFFVENSLFTSSLYSKGGVVWYRYHSLFAEAALRHFLGKDLAKILDIRKRAIEWYEANSYLDEAVKTAALLDDYATIERLILDYWSPLCIADDYVRLMRWFEYLPSGYTENNPVLASVESLPLALTSKTDPAFKRIQGAESSLDGREDELFGFVMGFKAIAMCVLGDEDETRKLATIALEHLGEDEVYLRSINLQVLAGTYTEASPEVAIDFFERSLLKEDAIRNNETFHYSVHSCLSFLYSILGRYAESEKWAKKALGLYPVEEHPAHPIFYYCYVARMNASYQKGDLEVAKDDLEYALEHGSDCWTPALIAQAYGVGALMAHLAHEDQQSLDAVAEALALSPLGFARNFPSLVALSFWLSEGAMKREDFIETLPRNAPNPLYWMVAAIDFLQKDYSRVDDLIECYLSMPEFRILPKMYFALLIALNYDALAQSAEADLWFERFLGFSRDMDSKQVCFENFLLIQGLLKKQVNVAKNPYAAQIFKESSYQGYRRRLSHEKQTKLTNRETEIMQLLAKGLSTKEIAQVLFISYETAKKHISNCYQKLGAHTRVQAVASFGEQYGASNGNGSSRPKPRS